MRLYKLTASTAGATEITRWGGSKADGVAFRKEQMEAGFKRAQLTEEEVEVPTDKTGLIKWLNEGGAL